MKPLCIITQSLNIPVAGLIAGSLGALRSLGHDVLTAQMTDYFCLIKM